MYTSLDIGYEGPGYQLSQEGIPAASVLACQHSTISYKFRVVKDLYQVCLLGLQHHKNPAFASKDTLVCIFKPDNVEIIDHLQKINLAEFENIVNLLIPPTLMFPQTKRIFAQIVKF